MDNKEYRERIIKIINSLLPEILKRKGLKITARTILRQTINCLYGQAGTEIFDSYKNMTDFVKHIPENELVDFFNTLRGIASTIDNADFAGKYDYSILKIDSNYSVVKDHTSYHKRSYKEKNNRTMYRDFVDYQKVLSKEESIDLSNLDRKMTKVETLDSIKGNCNEINKALIGLGTDTINYSEDDGFTVYTLSNEYKALLNEVVKSLYDSNMKAIILSYRLKGSYKITSLIPEDQLIYCDTLIGLLKDYLNKESTFDKNKTYEYLNKAGKELKKHYKNKIGISLLEGMNSTNSESTFKKEVLERLNYCLNEADEEEIYYGLSHYKDNLISVLPAKYENVKFYGTVTGAFNRSFYNLSNSELLSYLRFNGLHFSETKIEDFGYVEQNRYLYAAYSLLDEVYKRFAKEDAEALIEKTILLGRILREEYNKTHEKEPAVDLAEFIQRDKEEKMTIKAPKTRKRWRFEREEDSVKATIYEQMMLNGYNDENK